MNFLLERRKSISKSDISVDLLFEKLLEVVDNSAFKLLDSDKENARILCGTSTNFWTWGENIYIDLVKNEEDSTTIEFVSTTLFGGSSWKRNQNNYESFIESFEASLTI
jgi:hypothetical protein